MTALSADVNALDRAAFVARFGGIFEHSPWVAERAWPARPFADLEALHGAMVRAMRAGSADEKTALLRAHPELAGREAKEGRLTAASTGEQKSAGLDRLAPEEMRRLAELNAAYRATFGFPFIIAVRDNTKASILAAFHTRTGNDSATEFATACAQVERIAELRLKDILP